MIGTTGLKDLRIDCIVGIYEHERVKTQEIRIDVEIDYDFARAAASDAIPDAIDYDGVAASLTTLLQTRQFQLIETMAEESAALLLRTQDRAVAVRLEVRKPAAVPAASCSFVRVERVRP